MAHHFEADDTKAPLLHEPLPKGDCIVDITHENQNQNQDTGKHIFRVNSALVKTKSEAYKPKLISIGPYHMEEPGLENSIKQDFQNSLFKKIEGFKENCTQKLMELKDRARSWYAEDTQHMNDAQFVDMLLLDGCFVLELEKILANEGSTTGEPNMSALFVTDYVKVDGKVFQILSDMLLFENQLPFFVLFELFKLKHHALPESDPPRNDIDNDEALLQQLIVLVKGCFAGHVPKLTPQNLVSHEYTPQHLPKHLIQVVHGLCIPRNAKRGGGDDSGGVIEQIKTAAELEKDGVSFKKIGMVYGGYYEEGENFNAADGTTLFDVDFNAGILKIPSFKIDDNTETFLRNMIAYEQQSTDAAAMYFTDFACFMDQLIDSTADVKLLRRRGIIVNMMGTDDDDMVTKMFDNLCEGVVSYDDSFSGVINKVNRHGDIIAWNVWVGKLRQWKLISTVVGGLIATLVTAVSLKNLLR